MGREIIRKDDGDTVVLDYTPSEFPTVVNQAAENFVSVQNTESSDFKISELVADQVGITELQRKSIENKIEEMALDRLKAVEEKAYSESYELGLIEGTKKAFEDRKIEFEEQIQRIQTLLDGFQTIKERLLAENEATLMRLVHELASKIAMKQIDGEEGLIKDVLSKVVSDLQADDQIVVKISPEDLLFLESYKEKTGRNFDLLDRLKMEAADGIARGGCIIETNSGSIDASVKQRVNKAWEVIHNRVPKVKDQLEIENAEDAGDMSSDDEETGEE